MKRAFLLLVVFSAGFAQLPPDRQVPVQPPIPAPDEEARLPNGKLRRDELVISDFRKNRTDAAELLKLADELKADLERDDKYIVSVKTLKKTEDIEKLARNIRARLKRY